jgi:hypothetical protein
MASYFVRRVEALTGVRLRSAAVACMPRELLVRRVEAPNILARRYCYQLERRTYNALSRYEPGSTEEPWTVGRLLEIRTFGVFCLLDLLEVLASDEAIRVSTTAALEGTSFVGRPDR